VRATDGGASLVEIAKTDLQPLIAARPELAEELAALMEARLSQSVQTTAAARAASSTPRGLRQRMRAFLGA